MSRNAWNLVLFLIVIAFCFWLDFWFGFFWLVFVGGLMFIGLAANAFAEDTFGDCIEEQKGDGQG